MPPEAKHTAFARAKAPTRLAKRQSGSALFEPISIDNGRGAPDWYIDGGVRLMDQVADLPRPVYRTRIRQTSSADWRSTVPGLLANGIARGVRIGHASTPLHAQTRARGLREGRR